MTTYTPCHKCGEPVDVNSLATPPVCIDCQCAILCPRCQQKEHKKHAAR